MFVMRVLVFGAALSFVFGFQTSSQAAPSALLKCKSWLGLSWMGSQKIDEKAFTGLHRRTSFYESVEEGHPKEGYTKEAKDLASLKLIKGMTLLQRTKWKKDQKKVLEFLLMDDTLKIGIDLSNRATMASSRLNEPFLVISADRLLDKEAWIHEAAHWWITNEYPEVSALYQKTLEEAEKHSELQVAIDLRNALQLWFEIKANEISMANSSATLKSFQIYSELTDYWMKRLRISRPRSKSEAKIFREKLREEILSLIRWGYGVKLDEHHLQLFDH